ncbi:hypothetical protein K438DRAFT_2028941 [Mycena galopus ATCC 62051]|nr:hypothetical protein K438DRAFT_2028941 [Mycena galopus ATCC 62051]
MARKKKGGVRGRKSDFTGEKLEWLDSFRVQLQDAGDDPGPVYTEATQKFLLRYGYNLPFSENADDDPEDNPPVIEPAITPEEKARRAAIQRSLRQKLSNYFRNRWRAKKVHAAAIKSILGTMQTMTGPGARPRRQPAITWYSKLHYGTRIKPEFDAIWAKASKTLPQTQRVAMSQDHVRACWAKEPLDFKDAIEKEALERHRVDVEQWKASRTIPEGSAEEYHKAMESLSEVGIPMADALAERLGSHVVILVVGPVGSEKGEVCLRTYVVFSDTSNLQTSRTWAKFDHEGFTAMEASITHYGRAAFSKAQCRERAWPPLDDSGLPLDSLLSMNQDVSPPAPPVTAAMTAAPAVTSTARAATSTAATSNASPVTSTAPAAPAHGTSPAAASTTATTPTATSTAPAATSTAPAAMSIAATSTAPPTTSTACAAPAPGTAPAATPTKWSGDFVTAHEYLTEKAWGACWTQLLDALVAHEASFGHPDEDGKLPKLRTRPEEYHDWMKEHRHLKDYTIGPHFGTELMEWWQDLGPATRWENVGEAEGRQKEPSRIVTDFWSVDWGKLQKRGRNGVILLILGLAWWGQSVCNAAAGDGIGAGEAALEALKPWQLMVDDMRWVLEEVLTQGKMDGVDAERERILLEGEMAGGQSEAAKEKEGAGAANGEKGKKKGKKTVPKKVTPQAPPVTGRKRNRVGEKDLPIAKKLALGNTATVSRPKPRPMTRGAHRAFEGETQPAEGSRAAADSEAIPATNTMPAVAALGADAAAIVSDTFLPVAAVIPNGVETVPASSAPLISTPSQENPLTGSSLSTPVVSQPEPTSEQDAVVPQPEPTSEQDAAEMGTDRMQIDIDSDSAEMRVELDPTPNPFDDDPFANGAGLTVAELTEMVMDPDTLEEDDEDEEEDEEDD